MRNYFVRHRQGWARGLGALCVGILATVVLSLSVSADLIQEPRPSAVRQLTPRLREAYATIYAWDLKRAKKLLKPERTKFRQNRPLTPAEKWVLVSYYFLNFQNAEAQQLAQSLLDENVTEYNEDKFLEVVRYSASRLLSFKKKGTGSVEVYYEHPKDEVMVEQAVEVLQKMADRLSSLWEHRNTDSIRAVIVPDYETFIKMSTLRAFEIEGSGTIALCKYNRLFFVTPRALLRGYRWKDTLAHEYVHFAISKLAFNPIPIWFHEGVARNYEGMWRSDEYPGLDLSEQSILSRRRREKKLIAFERMHPSIAKMPTPEEASLAYTEVYLAIEQIRKTCGEACIRDLLWKVRRSSSPDAFLQALKSVTGLSIEGIEKKTFSAIETMKLEEVPGLQAPDHSMKDAKARERAKKEAEQLRRAVGRRMAICHSLHKAEHPLAAAVACQRAMEKSGIGIEPFLMTQVARLYVEAGEREVAQKRLEGVLRIFPGYGAAWRLSAEVHVASKSWEAAARDLEEYLAINPFNPEVYHTLINVYAQVGQSVRVTQLKRWLKILEQSG